MNRAHSCFRGHIGFLLAIVVLSGCAQAWVEKRSGNRSDDREEQTIRAIPEELLRVKGATAARSELDTQLSSIRMLLAPSTRQTVELSLDTFRSSLLQNNLDLKVSRITPQIAAAGLGAEFGRLDATLKASVASVRSLEDASENNRPTEALDSRYTGGEASLSLPLATGGSLEVGADLYSYQTVYLDGTRKIDPSQTAYPANLTAKVTIPLLEGAGYNANLGPIAVAAFDERISVVDLRNLLSNLLSSSEQVYWQLARSWEAIEIQVEMLDLARETLRDIRALAEAGVLPAFQSNRAELSVNQRRAAVLHADLDLRRDMRLVKILMNSPDLPLDRQVLLKPTSALELRALRLDPARLAKLALENRSELLRAELEIQKDELRLEMARRAVLPDLNLSGSIGTLGIQTDALDAIEGLFKGEFPPSWSVGLAFEMPLENRKARNDLTAANLSRLQTATNTRRIQLQILQEVYEAVDQIEILWAEILTQTSAVNDAEGNLAGVRQLLQTGLSSAVDVALAIDDLGDARLAALATRIRYQNAMIELSRATGTALGRQSIEVISSAR